MKMLFITAHFPLSDNKNKQESGAYFGGVERFVYETGKRLAKKHDVSVLATKVSSNEDEYEEIEGLKIHKVPVLFRLFRSPFSPAILGKINSIGSDVNIITATYPMFSDIAALASKLKGRKTIINYHFDGVAYGVIGKVFTKLYYKTLAKFMSVADGFIATSSDYARESAFLKGKKVSIVPNGVDSDFFKPGGRKAKKKILFAGRLVRYKGLEYLIDAMRTVADKIPDAKLAIIGDGPLRQELRDQIKALRLNENIKLLGHVPKNSLLKEYQSSGLFVLPSINGNEAFGITLIEAMSCGLPVIASDLPGVREIGKHGKLVEPKDFKQLADEIIRLLKNDKLREKMSDNSLKTVRARYSWDKVTDTFEKCITSSVRK